MTGYVALLGTKGGPAIRTGSTNPTSHVLSLAGQLVIVDCGLGVTRGIVDQGIALKDITDILITHLHSDHYLELGPLLHTAWVAGLKSPVTIYGPDGIAAYWHHFVASMSYDIDIRIEDEGRPDLRNLVTIKPIEEKFTIGELEILSTTTEHPPVICHAFRITGAGKSVVFSGDTAYLPRLADFAKGADLLIHEAMLAEALPALTARVGNGDDRLMKHLLRSHTTADDAARIASMAGVKALALNHLIPSDDPDYTEQHWLEAVRPNWNGEFHLGKDGLRIDL